MTGRFARFVTVAGIGFVLQLAALALFRAAGWHYLVATATAVELTALHNFCWHERWTWCDRTLSHRTVGRRLVHYHLTTASISVAGNVILTGAFVEVFGAHPVLATIAGVAVLAAVNFTVADRWVFAHRGGELVVQPPSGCTRIPDAFRPSRSRTARTPAPGVSL